jgi:hypothetical protein
MTHITIVLQIETDNPEAALRHVHAGTLKGWTSDHYTIDEWRWRFGLVEDLPIGRDLHEPPPLIRFGNDTGDEHIILDVYKYDRSEGKFYIKTELGECSVFAESLFPPERHALYGWLARKQRQHLELVYHLGYSCGYKDSESCCINLSYRMSFWSDPVEQQCYKNGYDEGIYAEQTDGDKPPSRKHLKNTAKRLGATSVCNGCPNASVDCSGPGYTCHLGEDIKIYRCMHCGYKNQYEGTMQNHLVTEHSLHTWHLQTDYEVLKVPYSEATRHLKPIPDNDRVPALECQFRCLSCGEAFHSEIAVKVHARSNHGIALHKNEGTMRHHIVKDHRVAGIKLNTDYIQLKPVPGDTYCCNFCSYTSDVLIDVIHHLEDEHGAGLGGNWHRKKPNRYRCTHCGDTRGSENEIVHHCRLQHQVNKPLKGDDWNTIEGSTE